MRVRSILPLVIVVLGCRRVPASIDDPSAAGTSTRPDASSSTPTPTPALTAQPDRECSVVAPEPEQLDALEHASWAELWRARGLGFSDEAPPSSDAELRDYACELSEGETGKPACDHEGPLALTIPTDDENVLLVVEAHRGGVRSVELGRWPILCRCDCIAELELVSLDPLVVLSTEIEHVADDVHFEGDEVLPGCDDPDTQDCQTACMGSGYGRRRLVAFGPGLVARERWIEPLEGEDFSLSYGVVDGRVVAQGQCLQVLVDRE